MKLIMTAAVAGFLGIALGMLGPSGAQAHANLVRSDPPENAIVVQAPVEVLFWFSEEVEVQFSRAQLVDAFGNRYDNDDFHVHGNTTNPGMTLRADIPQGTYSVVWNVLSAVDGHRTAGVFAFSIGSPSAGPPAQPPPSIKIDDFGSGSTPPRWLTVSARWLNFSAMAALIGAIAFSVIVLPAGLRAVRKQGMSVERAEDRAVSVVEFSFLAALMVLAAASTLSLWLQSWSAGGEIFSGSAIEKVLTDSRYGDIWWLRAGLIAAAAVYAFFFFARKPRILGDSQSAWAEPSWLALLALAVAIPLTTSLNSHAAAGSNQTLNTAVDWLHLVAGGVWIGGLLQLSLMMPAVLSSTEEESRIGFLAALIPRFSLVALVAVATIVTTGVIQSLTQLDGVDNLVDSTYGYTLLAKVMLLMPLLGLGAFNLLVVRPRFLLLTREKLSAAVSRVLRWEVRFRSAVAAEVVVAIVILAVTALLTETSPPGATIAAQAPTIPVPTGQTGTGIQSQTVGDLDLTLVVDPGTPGSNEIGLFITDKDGDERNVQRVIFRFTYKDQQLGTTEADGEPLHPNSHYILTTSQLSLAGDWEIEAIVRRDGLFDARTTFPVVIEP